MFLEIFSKAAHVHVHMYLLIDHLFKVPTAIGTNFHGSLF